MTAHQLIGLILRIFAIYLLFQVIPLIGYGVSLARQDGGGDQLLAYLVGIPFLIIIIVALWNFPLFIASKFLPRTNVQDKLEIPFNQFVRISIVCFALWILITRVLTQASYLLPLLVFISRNHLSISDNEQFQFVRVASIIIELIVAIVLIKKSRAISTYLARLGDEDTKEYRASE